MTSVPDHRARFADRGALLRLMDLNMWEMCREWTRVARGGEIFETPRLTLTTSPHGAAYNNIVLVRDAVDAGELVAATADFYGRRDRPFGVMTRAHADGALEAALGARGFRVLVTEPGMALRADPGARAPAAGLEIRPVTDDRGRRDFLEVSAAAWATYEEPRDYVDDAFAVLASVCSPVVQGFVGYAAGVAATAAALYLTHGVAGIGWVGTAPAYRGRGYGEAVTWAAVREGFRRGAAFASLQASPMGKAVYERMGFEAPTAYRLLVPAH